MASPPCAGGRKRQPRVADHHPGDCGRRNLRSSSVKDFCRPEDCPHPLRPARPWGSCAGRHWPLAGIGPRYRCSRESCAQSEADGVSADRHHGILRGRPDHRSADCEGDQQVALERVCETLAGSLRDCCSAGVLRSRGRTGRELGIRGISRWFCGGAQEAPVVLGSARRHRQKYRLRSSSPCTSPSWD
jgi:hypothetical protein